jgi:hypothetical protein
MKRIATVISVMVVSTLFSAMSIIAEDETPTPYGEDYGNILSPPIKNECLLVAKNCTTEYSTAEDRIDDLRKEISRGLDVYTPSELKQLEDQLKWLESESGSESI